MKRRPLLTLILPLAAATSPIFAAAAPAPNDPAPALQRQEIRAAWTDRAQITSAGSAPDGRHVLWYTRPAGVWEEALPIGNGSLGAMIFGGVADERLQLNEDTLWDGYPLDPNNPESAIALPEIRRLLFEGKNKQAVDLAGATMMGRPSRIKSYQTLGELWIETPHLRDIQQFRRTLDLEEAVASVSYTQNGVAFLREAFSTARGKVIVVRFTASKPGAIRFKAALKRQKDAGCAPVEGHSNAIILTGRIDRKDDAGTQRGIKFAAQLTALADGGRVSNEGGVLAVSDANAVTLLLAGHTSYPGLGNVTGSIEAIDPAERCAATINQVREKSFDALKQEHIADYQRYARRVVLDLGAVSPEVAALPTDERIARVKKTGLPDPGLVATHFQFGRYLLISSSRPATMPANLQGIWAWGLENPWNADFHININLQMNYWPAEITALPECHGPLFDLMDTLVEPGGKSARVLYNARGWVVHHLTDAWGFTAPADGPWGIWPVGAAWLALHPWEHYQYSGDKEFLRERGWPLMKGAARFLLDFLVEAPAGTPAAGKLVTNPSHSPENAFRLPNAEQHVFTYGAAMDTEITHELLAACIEAAKTLGVDPDFQAECQRALARLAPIQISRRTGGIQEWIEDYEEVEPQHRHVSHLFGLYPGSMFSLATPELFNAARKSLERRGDGATGWSLGWKLNLWARLHDGDHAFKLLTNLLRDKTLPNLFDTHPPFQIDGNFGAVSGVAEMLLQSHVRTSAGGYELHLLPALPSAWPKGSVQGLRARGGVTVDITWEDGKPTRARLAPSQSGQATVRYGESTREVTLRAGTPLVLNF